MEITQKIELAQKLWRKWAGALQNDPAVAALLKEMEERADASRGVSGQTGVLDACRRCDEREGGSCCGAGIENRYTPELLLINLLLGVELPGSRLCAKSCFFLGGRGCVLAARDILCTNYLCSGLQKSIPKEKLARLQETTGREMDTLFILHDKTRNFLRRHSR